MKSNPSAKEHYQKLRTLSCEELWSDEVPAFDRADPPERLNRVAVVRAVGVVFSEQGTAAQKELARQWLRGLLHDPQEKVRRYAMTALPKIGADTGEEAELLGLLKIAASDREKKFVGRALEKIGGTATLAATGDARLARRAGANVARQLAPSTVRLDRTLAAAAEIRIHLRCRRGLERILEDELHARSLEAENFRLLHRAPGLVAVAPLGGLRLEDVYALRCFGSASLVLGTAGDGDVEALAKVIASPPARRILGELTEGPVRYRLEFIAKGHQRGAVRAVADHVFELAPELLNDSRDAPWQIDIHPAGGRLSVELTPRLRPDPRFAYRRQDVPAASHPPLAASMARLAGRLEDEVVWDPFCGSGLELVECALRGGVRRVIGTDRAPAAISVAGDNFASALRGTIPANFVCCDFREHTTVEGLERGSVSLVISNPPMGRRVPIPNLRGLIENLFLAAGEVLLPGGRLVFANPLPVQPAGRALRLEFRQKVDLGGFDVHVEKYVKR